MLANRKNIFRLSLFFFLIIFGLNSCKKLQGIEYTPKVSPEAFLQDQHWLQIQCGDFSFIWSQPSSTMIVYFVGLFSIYAAYHLLRQRHKQLSARWWGIGLVLAGLGALFAGTSYQAFGYEIKCNGREFCTWTSWWEIIYLVLSVLGMNAFLVGTAYSSIHTKWRKGIIAYAIINAISYSVIILYGVQSLSKFILSFEFMVFISAPTVIFLLLLHGIRYATHKEKLDLLFIKTWLLLAAVGIAYEIYLLSSLTSFLWHRKIWFTENDVLHLGMICWIAYIINRLSKELSDLK